MFCFETSSTDNVYTILIILSCQRSLMLTQISKLILSVYRCNHSGLCTWYYTKLYRIKCNRKVIPLFIDMQERYTPLHYASMNGHEKIVEQFLKAGAEYSAVNEVST